MVSTLSFQERLTSRRSTPGISTRITTSPGRSQTSMCGRYMLFPALQQVFELAHELLHVLEVEINRGEPYVGDFIQIPEIVHDHRAQDDRGNLAFAGVLDHCLRLVGNAFELRHRYRTLLAGFQDSGQDFLAVEAFAPPVF